MAAAAAVACDRDAPTEPTAASGDEAAAPEAEADGPPDPCTYTVGTAMIDGVRLESADGACRLYLPTAAEPGRLAVRISRVGDDTAAAAERDTDDGTLYATTGSVTVTEAGDGRYVGRIDARDETPPGTGSLSGAFDVTLGATP